MLVVSDAVMQSFHAEGLAKLRTTILAGWHENLRPAGELVGEDGRNRILMQIQQMSLDDKSLTFADLTMLADLMLVDAANEIRKKAAVR